MLTMLTMLSICTARKLEISEFLECGLECGIVGQARCDVKCHVRGSAKPFLNVIIVDLCIKTTTLHTHSTYTLHTLYTHCTHTVHTQYTHFAHSTHPLHTQYTHSTYTVHTLFSLGIQVCRCL